MFHLVFSMQGIQSVVFPVLCCVLVARYLRLSSSNSCSLCTPFVGCASKSSRLWAVLTSVFCQLYPLEAPAVPLLPEGWDVMPHHLTR